MEAFTLKADTRRLLDLVIHSLYTRPEVFLRELVSNASDALDRFRFESMLDSTLMDDGSALDIRLEVDPVARTLTVRDNGIGMARDEVVQHIGTIARSGTKEFTAQLEGQAERGQMVDLIGRFGVGFYSCFMVAEKVTLVTRRAGEEIGTSWESTGDINYTMQDVSGARRGTSVTLTLKAVDIEGGIEDYTNQWVLSKIVKRYADFIAYPIVYVGPTEDVTAESEAARDVVAATVVLNSMKPIWTRPQSEVTPAEYKEFYKHMSQDWNEPLQHVSFKAEGRWEYAALLFIPSHAPYDLYYHAYSFGLQLYSHRMLIVENCQELLPRYLRFLKGVVDAADLPLNVSRQMLQHSHHLTSIRKWLTRKVVDSINKLRETDSTKYLTLWKEFGRALKEGVSEDSDNKERLLPLLLFESSFDGSMLTSLADYVSRMKPEQKDIFYLGGQSRTVIEHSPHLEELRARGYEVLYFTEPVDELLAQAVTEFDGHRLRSAAKGQIELEQAVDRERVETEENEHAKSLDGLLKFMAKHLESRVRAVRISKRLKSSPACLASDEFELSPHIERLLKGRGEIHRRTLELNASHRLVKGLNERFTRDAADPALAAAADLLLGVALLAEGSELPDPSVFATEVTELLTRSLEVSHERLVGERHSNMA
ncbi:MAG TPA: molecular chaperone HtpG [Vicinamibacterales bacterium]|nr:molecular chaperone HtpG [Vicinamibacterales bacterium]